MKSKETLLALKKYIQNKKQTKLVPVGLVLVLLIILGVWYAGATESTNIHSEYKYAWSENGGWLNFGSTNGGLMVNDSDLTGYAWSENFGWISMNCSNDDSCAISNYKVANDGEGHLSGYAWSDTAGWINFSPTDGGVDIDSVGIFSGYAWSENFGWIVFSCQDLDVCVTSDFKVETSWRPISVRESGEAEGLEVSDVHFSSTDSMIVIDWDTNHDADSHVRWGTDENLEKEKNDNNFEKKHRTTIKDLDPNTRYFFRIKSTDRNDQSDRSKVYEVTTKKPSAIFARRPYQRTDKSDLTYDKYETVEIEVSDKSKNEVNEQKQEEEKINIEKQHAQDETKEDSHFLSNAFSYLGGMIKTVASGVWNGTVYVANGIHESLLGGQRGMASIIKKTGEKFADAYVAVISKFNKEKAVEIAEKNEKKFFTALVSNKNEKKIISEVKFQILDRSDNPIPNLETTLFSDPQTSVTNEDGIASFNDVPIGSHTLAFAHQGEEFEKKVSIADTLTEEGKVRAEVVQVKAEKEIISAWMWSLIMMLIVAILTAVIFAKKYYVLKDQKSSMS